MCHKMGATEHAGHSEDLALQESWAARSWAWVQGLIIFVWSSSDSCLWEPLVFIYEGLCLS